jgi:hypothetical protein
LSWSYRDCRASYFCSETQPANSIIAVNVKVRRWMSFNPDIFRVSLAIAAARDMEFMNYARLFFSKNRSLTDCQICMLCTSIVIQD